MSTIDEKRALREQGFSYTEIARQLGISKQAVQQGLAEQDMRYFQFVTEKGCIYPNIRKWMNDNRVSVSEIARRMGLLPHSCTSARIRSYLTGRVSPNKPTIDKILSITNLTYEQAFYREEN